MPKRSLTDQLDQAIERMLARPHGELPEVDGSLAPLLQIARQLRDLPRENFKPSLKSDLERTLSMATARQPIAAVRTFASPRLSYKSAAKAIEFYEKAFGAKESWRFETESGIGHAEIMIGDSTVMLCEEWPEGGRYSAETLGQSPVSMTINVPDVDAFVEHAVAAGAKLTGPITDQFYGHRDGTLLDPFGYAWNVYTVKEEISAEEMHRRFRTVGSAGGLHAEARVGDSMLMIGGGIPGREFRSTPNTHAIHMYVEDVDAVYQKALGAGAESIDEVIDQEYGERSGGVKDPAGNYWYIATHKGETYVPKGLHNVNAYLHPLRAEPVINFLKRAFGAQEIAKYALADGVVHHAEIRVGDSVVEMGEAHGKYQPLQSMFYLYVPDCDSVYRRALAAGATSIAEPQDHPYGDRSGGVQDPFGNQWYIATHIKDV